jgi:hypothetical protein
MTSVKRAESELSELDTLVSKVERSKLTRSSNYGHDLLRAVSRGWQRKTGEYLRQALKAQDRALEASVGAKNASKYRTYRALLGTLIEQMARDGLTADEIRAILGARADRHDSLGIDETVKRFSR